MILAIYGRLQMILAINRRLQMILAINGRLQDTGESLLIVIAIC